MSEIPSRGGPAFPVAMPMDEKGQEVIHWAGMSLRDYFAGKALPMALSCTSSEINKGESVPQMFARKAYEVADAMLAEREKEPS